ncbi:MAG: CCA tRNA nucleotidyltransferase [bacterium]|nr:CCA tRNA nucleotidyltransferase [bacterium]
MKTFQLLKRKKELLFISQLQKQFPKAEIFLVGGIVRDTLLGLPSKDYDFVIRNIPTGKLLTFLKTQGWVDLVGKKFGVLKFTPRGSKLQIDIALPRTEHAFNTGGYKDFDVQSDYKLPIEDDLARRDFTINALAYNWQNNKIIDLYKGLDDLKKKRIKTVGLAEDRFKEDYSRTLRAIRFACQLDFVIENKTWTAIKKLTPKINTKIKGDFVVPRETIAKEMVKAFVNNPAKAFMLYDKSGLAKQLMPELLKMKKCPQPKNFHSEGDVWQHTLMCLENLQSKKFQKRFDNSPLTAELVLATIFHDLGKPYTIKKVDRLRFNNHDTKSAELSTEILNRLKISNAEVDIDKVNWLCRKHMITTHTKKSPMKNITLEKYFFNKATPGFDLLRLTFADVMATVPQKTKRPDFKDFNSIVKQIDRLRKTASQKQSLPKVIINGHEIMKYFKLKSGPAIGKLLNALREEQLKGKIKTKQQAYAWLKKHV